MITYADNQTPEKKWYAVPLLNYLTIVLALSLSTSLPLLAADVMGDKDNSGTRLHLADLRYPVATLATRRYCNG